mgnify:FL=1
MNSIELKLDIRPLAHQSVRFTRSGRSYKPKKVLSYQQNIVALGKQQIPKDFVIIEQGTPIVVEFIHYSYAYLKSTPKKKRIIDIPKTTKPDLQDNLNKAFFDALEGLVYEQDQNIVEISSLKKFYSDRDYIHIKINY